MFINTNCLEPKWLNLVEHAIEHESGNTASLAELEYVYTPLPIAVYLDIAICLYMAMCTCVLYIFYIIIMCSRNLPIYAMLQCS